MRGDFRTEKVDLPGLKEYNGLIEELKKEMERIRSEKQ